MKILKESASPHPLVATIGFFDGVHVGHRHLLQAVVDYARHRGVECAAITFPVHPRKVLNEYFQPETLTNYEKKLELIGATGVDSCIVIDFTPEVAALTARGFLEMLARQYGVTTLFMGYDHRFGSDRIASFETYVERGREVGVEVLRADAFVQNGQHVSSSLIRKMLLAGNIREATHALGRPYRMCGSVIRGHRIGRQIGFPTANLRLSPPDQLIPRIGVYAVKVWVNDEQYGGMANIGLRPTVHDNGGLSVEVHLFDFNGDLYDHTICIDLIEFLRPEKKFDNRDQLTLQLAQDREKAMLVVSG